MKPIYGIDKVYVLSVRTFTDRIEHITQELSKHGIPFEFIFEFDVPDISQEDLNYFADSQLSLAQKSLVLKHIRCWQLLVNSDHSRVLVFEDDAILCDDFRIRIDEISKFADSLEPGFLVYLGGAASKVSKEFLTFHQPLVPRRLHSSEALFFDRLFASKYLQWLESNKVTLPADHLINKIGDAVGLSHYWPKEVMVEQASCTGMLKTTLDRSRSKHSLLFVKIRYYWRKFKNQTLKRWFLL